MTALLRGGARQALANTILLLLALSTLTRAAFINFQDCLDPNIINSRPRRLQWVPLFVDATFNTTAPSHELNVTLYGNVTGQTTVGEYPPPDSPSWSDPNNTFGKITNVGTANKYSTLVSKFNLLTYDAWDAPATQFCPTLVNGTCPLGPYFDANASDPYTLPAFRVSHDFYSTYAFGTLAATIRVISGDDNAADIACVSANITPDLGSKIAGLITWLPAVILILKGVATLAAAIWSPWGSSDIFRWSSNYGRDEDLLRLVTPGFGDCLQYIQFVALTGSLSLNYPGFYQPAVSQTTWSTLLFNESFVSHESGTQALSDGIYTTNGTYGMTRMSQLVGMSRVEDIWACMAVWLLVIAGIVVVLCQLGFLGRWAWRAITNTPEEDLRRKNFPFTVGNMVRLLFNFFILPIVAISLFQLVVAPRSPTSVVVMAVILFVIMLLSAAWILRVIFKSKPRTYLFDDMPTVLMYGPLYNTYSDSAAPFAFIPVFITFMRGVAIGAVQPSGIAQIIVLAICEVILILTLNAFRPFQNQTSMNAYHTAFAAVRLSTILLAIAFVPSLGVDEAPRGWIGYAILLLHACVLVFGFFLNSAQTIIEVIARSMGVAGDPQHGATRGSILNWRMLRKRQNRPPTGDRASMTSAAAILQDQDARSTYGGTRSRSLSASSQQLLNQVAAQNRNSGFENFSSGGDFVGSPGAEGSDVQAAFTYMPNGKPVLGVKTDNANVTTDTFYRPPRARRTTIDALTPASKTRQSGNSVDFPYSDSPGAQSSGQRGDSYESTFMGRDSPAPAYVHDRQGSDENAPHTDYAVREVDQYYRGAALSDQPTRKLKTGPADPTGPAANAQSWFQRLLFGVQGGKQKQKEKSKGFEVVRSARMPPEMQQGGGEEEHEMVNSPPMHDEPYRDSPPLHEDEAQAAAGAERGASPVEDPPKGVDEFHFGFDGAHETSRPSYEASSPIGGEDENLDHGLGLGLPPHPLTRPSGDTSRSADHPGMRAEQPGRSRPSQDAASSRYNTGLSSDYADSSFPPHLQSSVQAHQQQSHSSEVPSLAPIESFGGLDLPSRFNSVHQTSNQASPYNPDLEHSTGGQDWLKAVDELDRPAHERRAPNVPRRSSRRTPSQDIDFTHPGSPPALPSGVNTNMDFAGFDSAVASPPEQDRDNYMDDDEEFTRDNNERPTSFQVNQHRAADSITRNSWGARQMGLSGEVFGDEDDRRRS